MKRDQIDHFRKALFAARVERERLVKEARELDEYRQALEFLIDHAEQSIHGLATLLGEEDIDVDVIEIAPDLSLADACRKVLAASDRFMSPVRVRNELRISKYPLKEHRNALSAIHGVLKRFEESGEAEALKMAGKTGYRLKRIASGDNCSPKHSRQAKKTESPKLKKFRDEAAAETAAEVEMPLLLTEGSLKN